jgi:biopolymer transport protein ExbD
MNFRSNQAAARGEMQMAPMIDIVFLLLIFFIVTWNYARFETELNISVPAAEEGQDPQRSIGEIIVNVREDGVIVVLSQELTEEQLLGRLSELAAVYRDQAVILRGDSKTSYEDIVKVLDICQKAGIWNVAFATRRPD